MCKCVASQMLSSWQISRLINVLNFQKLQFSVRALCNLPKEFFFCRPFLKNSQATENGRGVIFFRLAATNFVFRISRRHWQNLQKHLLKFIRKLLSERMGNWSWVAFDDSGQKGREANMFISAYIGWESTWFWWRQWRWMIKVIRFCCQRWLSMEGLRFQMSLQWKALSNRCASKKNHWKKKSASTCNSLEGSSLVYSQ